MASSHLSEVIKIEEGNNDQENEENEDEKFPTRQRWSLTFLKGQFHNMEKLYMLYISRLQYGYFSLYLILQILLSTAYSLIIVFENEDESLKNVWLDVVIYAITTIVPFLALIFLKEGKKNLQAASLAAYLLIYAIDALLPVYHYVKDDDNMRTPFTTHLIIACYIFFSIDTLWLALSAGSIVTATHLVLCATITFRDFAAEALLKKLIIELIYFGSINALGVYFRYMNEIMYRRSFLAKKDETIEKLTFNHKLEEQRDFLEIIFSPKWAENIMLDKDLYNFMMKRHVDKSNVKPFYFKHLTDTHKNVTVLYADIVNYTEMTTRLKPVQLIQVLNDLFGGFDDDSEELQVVRIKFLGDCYYCVSGMDEWERGTFEMGKLTKRGKPKSGNKNHADSCVRLGLRMITRIKAIASEYKIDLNMRIGIHTGDIRSALIGRTKWQLEIWSEDVQLANTMESSGFPGKVHLTQETMNELLKQNVLVKVDNNDEVMKHKEENYFVYKTTVIETNKKLQESTSMTYCVTPEELPGITVYDDEMFQPAKKNAKNSFTPKRTTDNNRGTKLSENLSRLSTAKESTEKRQTKVRYSQVDKRSKNNALTIAAIAKFEALSNQLLTKSIEEMPLSKQEQWFKEKEINPFFLTFKTIEDELRYMCLEDHLYKYYINSVLLILLCFIAIRYIAIPEWEHTTLLSILTALALLLLAPLLLLSDLCRSKLTRTSSKSFWGKILHGGISKKLAESFFLRTALYVVLCTIFTACFVIELTHCNYDDFQAFALHSPEITLQENKECLQAWNITETINLTLIMSFLFLKIHVWIKFLYGAIITAGYSYWIWNYAYSYYDNEPSFHYMMKPPIAHIINIIFLTTTLHFVDRQADYLNRLDHKWNRQIEEEMKKTTALHQVTLDVLEHVMPKDVAVKYWIKDGNQQEKKLYCERYKNVAVIFATIVQMDDTVLDEILTVNLLNEMISDFDSILLKKYRGQVEKIKLANLKTYVACAGLMPGKINLSKTLYEDGESGTRTVQVMEDDKNLINMLKFAIDMRKALEKHNRDCGQEYKLKIGICGGNLTAGVVGTKKPYYDIWGDCVNVASRMDSSGAVDKIHVNESTEMVFRRNAIRCSFKEYEFIKGKGWLNTYYVDIDDKGDFIYDPSIIINYDDSEED